MSSIPSAILAHFERQLNRGIAKSAAAGSLAATLDKSSLVINAQPPTLGVRLSVVDGTLRLREQGEEAADITIAGTPLELMRMFFIDAQAPIREGRVTMSGSAETAERFRELIKLAGPDVEQELARLIGTPAAFQVSNFSQSLMHWARTMAENTADHVADILQEDSELLPTPEELEPLYADIDTVSDAVARLEARMKRLAGNLDTRDTPAS